MAAYIALLRGVNVGGNMLKMDRLRELCAKLGMQNVRTYVQSGNVVFQAQGSGAQWAELLERKLMGETRLPVTVIVRSAAEMAAILAGNPFLKEKGIDTARLHVTFLQQASAKSAVDSLANLKAGLDRLRCIGKEIYLHCPNGYGQTKLSNNALEKALGVKATTRNWNTVQKLCEMAKDTGHISM